MDHEQTMGVNSRVLDQKQQNIFGRILLFWSAELQGHLEQLNGGDHDWLIQNNIYYCHYRCSLMRWTFSLGVICSGCKHDGKLYVSGGFRGPVHGHISQFCCYDAECDIWHQKAPLTQPRSYHSMASVYDHIIVAGGVHYRGGDAFDDLLVIILSLKNTECFNVSVDSCNSF